jgi:hypothetical protein
LRRQARRHRRGRQRLPDAVCELRADHRSRPPGGAR